MIAVFSAIPLLLYAAGAMHNGTIANNSPAGQVVSTDLDFVVNELLAFGTEEAASEHVPAMTNQPTLHDKDYPGYESHNGTVTCVSSGKHATISSSFTRRSFECEIPCPKSIADSNVSQTTTHDPPERSGFVASIAKKASALKRSFRFKRRSLQNSKSPPLPTAGPAHMNSNTADGNAYLNESPHDTFKAPPSPLYLNYGSAAEQSVDGHLNCAQTSDLYGNLNAFSTQNDTVAKENESDDEWNDYTDVGSDSSGNNSPEPATTYTTFGTAPLPPFPDYTAADPWILSAGSKTLPRTMPTAHTPITERNNRRSLRSLPPAAFPPPPSPSTLKKLGSEPQDACRALRGDPTRVTQTLRAHCELCNKRFKKHMKDTLFINCQRYHAACVTGTTERAAALRSLLEYEIQFKTFQQLHYWMLSVLMPAVAQGIRIQTPARAAALEAPNSLPAADEGACHMRLGFIYFFLRLTGPQLTSAAYKLNLPTDDVALLTAQLEDYLASPTLVAPSPYIQWFLTLKKADISEYISRSLLSPSEKFALYNEPLTCLREDKSKNAVKMTLLFLKNLNNAQAKGKIHIGEHIYLFSEAIAALKRQPKNMEPFIACLYDLLAAHGIEAMYFLPSRFLSFVAAFEPDQIMALLEHYVNSTRRRTHGLLLFVYHVRKNILRKALWSRVLKLFIATNSAGVWIHPDFASLLVCCGLSGGKYDKWKALLDIVAQTDDSILHALVFKPAGFFEYPLAGKAYEKIEAHVYAKQSNSLSACLVIERARALAQPRKK